MSETPLPYDDTNPDAAAVAGDAATLAAIPTDDNAIPDAGKNPESMGRKNWAGKTETVAKFLSAAQAHFDNFDSQSTRGKMLDRMDTADKFFRLAKDQTKQTLNKTTDEIDTIPHVFNTVVKIATANENDILFGQRDLPMKYIPLTNLAPAMVPETQQVCDDRNVQLEWSMTEDERLEKMKLTMHFLNKYGNRIVGMSWFQEERVVKERMPDPDKPGQWKLATVKKITAHPCYTDYDMEDFWFDLQINDYGRELENQQCVLHRFYPLYQELYASQQAKELMNVENIRRIHMYSSEYPSTAKGNRQDNADEQSDTNRPTGLLDAYHIWLRAPINEKGEWDEEGTLATWHWATFIGSIGGNGGSVPPVCVRLIPNPYKDGCLPYKLIHAFPDDKCAIHLGLIDIIEPAWNEYKTTMDEWFYNKEMVNNAPWKTEEGAMVNADMGFGPRRLKIMRQGKFDKLERVQVLSNTNDMQAFLNFLETKIYVDLAGLTRAFRGEEMGSRTSALEAGNALGQSVKPAMEMVRYKAGQLLPWVAAKDAMLMEQFAAKDMVVGLAAGMPSREIKPANLYGDFRVKVTAIDTFVSTMMARQEQDRFLQVNMPLAAPDMGKRGRIATWKWVFATRGFPVDEMFPLVSETDAKHVAGSENVGFLNGIEDIPKDGEDHDTHLSVHDSFIAVLDALPNDRPEKMTALPLATQHKVLHEQLKSQEEAAVQGAAQQAQQAQQGAQSVQGLGTGETPPMDGGQAAGQLLGAEGGMLAG